MSALGQAVQAQEVRVASIADPSARIAELESTVTALSAELDQLRFELGQPALLPSIEDSPSTDMLHDVELVDASFSAADSIVPCSTGACAPSTHYVTYDGGWVLRPRQRQRTPFELRFGFHTQFRHTGFVNEVDTFTDSAGNTGPINPRNDFDFNRGRLIFSGYAFDPKFGFYTNIDYNTVSLEQLQLLLGWLSYQVNDRLTLKAGLGKLPGSWEWNESSRYVLGAERTMATTFFRPSITAGIWAEGQLTDSLAYRAMLGDGFNTFTLRAADLDTNLVSSGLMWWEPLGEFGVGFSDLESHDRLAVRVGQGVTYDRSEGDRSGLPGPEQTVIRLSDGTVLVEPGALAPGVTVNRFDILLYTVHCGFKRRGLSLATEYYFRWLDSIRGTAPLPDDSLFDHGFYVQGGAFVVPERLEPYFYGSQVSGDFGHGSEIGAGCNWYFGGRRNTRFTFDVVHLDSSPASQSRTGLVAGATGTLFRTQFWAIF